MSIDDIGNLLLMDDGLNSTFQTPPGRNRKFSSPRSYTIDVANMTATEIYAYTQHDSIYTPICSSVYEDVVDNYLIDYSVTQDRSVMEIVGLKDGKSKVFDYQYPAQSSCSSGWNAEIIHWDNLQF